MKRPLIFALLTILACSMQMGGADRSFTWPSVASLNKTYRFEGLPSTEPRVDLNILDTAGKPVYRLLCHSGDYKGGSDLQYENENFDFVGVFDCHLFPLYSPDQKSYNLLISDPLDSRPTRSRAALMGADLMGKCAEYPEYGAVRNIRLRGMEIIFRYTDVIFSESKNKNEPPIVQSFGLNIDVRSDPSAISSISNQVEVAYPTSQSNGRLDCSTVVRRHVLGRVTNQYLVEKGLKSPFLSIEAAEKVGHISDRGEKEIVVPIKSTEGKTIYDLRCSYQGTLGIDCGVYLSGENLNLLSNSVDPYSTLPRSLIRPEQLYNSCGRYPEWGSIRTFKLRGMKITLQFTNAKLSSGSEPPDRRTDAITEVEVSVLVEPDPSSNSPLAGPPLKAYWGYLPLETPCQSVVDAPR